jgi:hypothetical protein
VGYVSIKLPIMLNKDKKMKSILQQIKELDIKNWYYYYSISENKLENPFDDRIEHMAFIKKYFQRSGKKEILQKFDVNNFLPLNAPHTNSVFFLGAFLYYNTIFKDYIDNSLTQQGYRMFPFVWFLITLFHDFGYKYEEEFDKYKHIETIETLRKELSIKFNLLNYKKLKGISLPLYNSIQKYFLYRRFNSIDSKKIDHGILAGLFFYDALVRNRIRQQNKNKTDKLYFRRELNRIYARAAIVIATHNIWLPNESNSSEYKKFGLGELIGMPPVRLKESPLLILLGIVDTIDPVKIYSNSNQESIDYADILDNILIYCDEAKIVLKKSENAKLDFGKIIEKANDLKGWLDVNIEPSSEKLVIEINT